MGWFDDFFGSSKDKPTTTNTTSQPWEPSQPFLKDVMGQGQGLFNQTKNAKPQGGAGDDAKPHAQLRHDNGLE
jgi:hypothetical protein